MISNADKIKCEVDKITSKNLLHEISEESWVDFINLIGSRKTQEWFTENESSFECIYKMKHSLS